MAMRKEFVTSAIGDRRADRWCAGSSTRSWSPGSARWPSRATPTGSRSTSTASSSARRSSARTSRCRSTRTASRRCRTASRSPTPDPRYFQTRPSGTMPADNDAATTFANYGPNSTSPRRRSPPTSRPTSSSTASTTRAALTAAKVPVDAADTSASGHRPRHLDRQRRHPGIPDRRRAASAAARRSMHLISKYTAGRGLGFSGEPGVDVLELNLALNRL